MDTRFDPIPWARPSIDQTETDAVVECLTAGRLSAGPRVARFESLMADRAGRRFAVAVTNGTAALELAMRVLAVGPGDEVIVPALSYVATAAAPAVRGATPRFCDVEPDTLGMDAASGLLLLSAQTRAIVTTDHGGCPCDYEAISRFSDDAGVPLVVDGAQSIGATFAGRPTLSYGLLSTTSFHAAKLITTGEGGMVFTDDADLDRRLRVIRSQGEDPARKYHHVALGHNYRMTELQAAIGLAQLSKLDALSSERQELAAEYRRRFIAEGIEIGGEPVDGTHARFLFNVFVPDRDDVMRRLAERGIDTRACYPTPLYAQPIFSDLDNPVCPVAERACRTILNPPMFAGMTIRQQGRVVDAITEALQVKARKAA